MAERGATIHDFLAQRGFEEAIRVPLAGDASVRRYERLRGGPSPAVLMDAPPDQLDVDPFIRMAQWLRHHGLSAPEVIAADTKAGLVLLEDLGDDLFNRILSHTRDEEKLYRAAVDLLLDLQRKPVPEGLPPYDEAKLLSEAELLVEWLVPELHPAAKSDYRAIWRDLLPARRVGADTIVYVDYHADNLIWLPDRQGLARVGLLDFQDARLGSPVYDLVSLLEDARRDVDPALAQAMVDHYLAARPELEPEAVETAYAVLGAQRNSKILGLFSRLARRDGKAQYLEFLPRVWGHLRRDLRHPYLTPLRRWFERHLPDSG